MFYSESLLSKTGPLARVWLASNVERKLSKSQILQSDIQSSVGAIVGEDQAPMALRLSGQLMLGVVRIYGRKARYLLDDCNDALMKIKMTFKSTANNDLPHQNATANDLNLPDMLTVDDLFPAMDLPFPMSQAPVLDANVTLQDFGQDWTSTLNPQRSTQSRLAPDDQLLLNDDDLALDLGDDVPMDGNDTSISIEVGRNEPAARPVGEDLFDDNDQLLNGDDLELDLGEDVPMPDQPIQALNPGFDDIDHFGGQDDGMAIGDDETLQLRNAVAGGQRPRDGDSPLSDANSIVMRDLDRTFMDQEEIEEVAAQQPQRSRKLKPIVADVETVLHNKQIKAQAEDRSKILRPAAFLPRDPVLLTLMNMQKNGGFVSSVMNDGGSRNLAPELQGLLSFDVVRRSRDHKRKRDSGIADMSEDEHSQKSPRLELPEDDEGMMQDEGVDFGGELSMNQGQLDLPADIGAQLPEDGPLAENGGGGEEDEGIYAGDDGFDETTMPLIHPADNGPVSLGTKHAVHMLRERFGGQEIDGSPSSQMKKSVLLQDMVPEGQTSKEDATKMFFEILVLATKDAIKVDQADKAIGLPLRVRGKRGLWGAWAETATAGESLDADGADVALSA